MAASYRLDIASGASSYCTGWALPSFLRCRKQGAEMDTATKRVKYAGDTSCFEPIEGFNGKYATDGETIINTESRYIVKPRIVDGREYYRLVRPDGKKCERSLASLLTGKRAYTRSGDSGKGKYYEALTSEWSEGKSIRQIALHFGCSQSSLNRYAREHGFTVRTRDEYNSERHAAAVERWGREKRPRREQRAKWWCEKTGAEFDPLLDLDALLERNGYQCNACGKTTTKEDLRWGNYGPDYPTLDHIVRLSDGGSHTFDNAQVLCAYCNVIIKG